MTFKVEKLSAAEKEITELSQAQQEILKKDYEKIETQGIEFVRIKSLQSHIFEIKTNEIRSLFKYKEGRIVVIGVVFVKKTAKTPRKIIKLAKKRLEED